MSDADTSGSDGKPRPIDPALYHRDDVRRILVDHDFGVLYRVLEDDSGLSQRQIAERTGQSQSEVSEILRGRRVENYRLLVRLSQGLGIPPEQMGLSWWAPDNTCCGVVPVAELPPGVSAEMLRRHLLALGASATFGVPASEPMPSRLFGIHV